jgi:uncharacterized protein (DUF1330 family)
VFAALLGASIGGAAIHGLHAQAKPKAYVVSELETLDAKAAADYAERALKMQEAAGGRNLRTGGGKVTAMEGPPPPQRVAITEWENLDKAQAFFKSKEWADAGPDRDKALKTVRRYAVDPCLRPPHAPVEEAPSVTPVLAQSSESDIRPPMFVVVSL